MLRYSSISFTGDQKLLLSIEQTGTEGLLFDDDKKLSDTLLTVIDELKKNTADLYLQILIDISLFDYEKHMTAKPEANMPDNSFSDLLSKREKEVLKLVFDGMSNKEIAKHLFISLETVKSHRKNILSKTESRNTASLVRKINPNDL